MANVTLRSSSALLTRFSSSAATAAAAATPREYAAHKYQSPEAIRVTKLESGLVVASIENYSPVTRIAAIVNAGARDELPSQLGVSHALRAYSNLATRNFSSFGITRNLNQIGAELKLRAVDILSEVVVRPLLHHWEIHDAQQRLKFDLDVYDESAETRLADLIYRASFRTRLGNSLYAPRFNVSGLNEEAIGEFRRANFTANRLTLVGVGISHEQLLRHADFFKLPTAAATSSLGRDASSFVSSEIREHNSDQLVHAAVSSEGAALSGKDLLASRIVKHLFGTSGQRVKYTVAGSKLSRAVLPLASKPAGVSAFNANYSDAGLFGFHVVAHKSDVGKVLKGVAKEVAKVSKNGITSDELNSAKASLKMSLALALESSHGLIETIGSNTENSSQLVNISEVFKAVDAVPASDVNNFIKKIATGKSSMAAIGDLSETPRLDELTA